MEGEKGGVHGRQGVEEKRRQEVTHNDGRS